MKFTTINSEMGRRITLYLGYRSYFDEKVLRDPKWKRKGSIAVEYISTNKTLREVGKENTISQERVRQIVAEFLRKIVRIYERNKKELEVTRQEANNKQEEAKSAWDVVGQDLRDIENIKIENVSLKRKIKMYERIINNDLQAVSQAALLLQEATAKMMGVTDDKVPEPVPIRQQLKEELFPKNNYLKTIRDEGTYGHFLKDIEIYLGDTYPKFLNWYKGKTGGIIDGKVYVFRTDFETFLAANKLTTL